MAGKGERFKNAGYEDAKPFIRFLGKTMIEHVVNTFPVESHKIFLVLKEHEALYNATEFLTSNWLGSDVILIDHVTDGAARTVLLAKDLINNDDVLAIMNSDNIIHWDPKALSLLLTHDGLIMTFEDVDPKWSFVLLDDAGLVIKVEEKNPISTHATAGLYFWSNGSKFVEAAELMIDKNIRTNNEFYVAPIYTQNAELGHKIAISQVDEMHGVGTPKDLENYINSMI